MPTRRLSVFVAVAALLPLSFAPLVRGQSPNLEASFRNPPEAAWPRTWWHWTGSNVTLEGITKDLEWMKRAGFAGFQLADVASGRGHQTATKIPYGSPEWYAAVRHAAAEAQRLGLEMTIFSSPGWSITGGPTVRPEQAMKKLVWSETRITGPARFRGALPAPPSNNGPIRNLRAGNPRPGAPVDPTHYGDAKVVAFRTPVVEHAPAPTPRVTSSAGSLDGAPLLDDDLNSTVTLAAPADGAPVFLQYEYAEPFKARAFTISGRGGIPVGRVLAGDDSSNLRPLVMLPGAQLYRQGSVRTFAFPAPIEARIFRLELTGAPIRPAETMSEVAPQPAKEYILAEAIFHAGARVHRAEEKAGFSFLFDYSPVDTPAVDREAVIAPAEAIDLTDRLRPDGTLDWDVPAGEWTIMRFGYSLTGAKNRPAVPSGLGYEADKLSRRHMESYLQGYFDPLERELGPLHGTALSHVLIDSWEAGYHNWTEEMPEEFRRRRGYDLTPWLPALAGRIVGDAGSTDRFLWDFRRTLADMWAEHHYEFLTTKLNEKKLRTYSEASGVSLEIPEDTLLNKSKVDIPMGEFWVRDLHPRLMYYQDVRGAASAGFAYGKPIVGAEAFTGGGFESPATLKSVADYWMPQGINRIIFHTSAHQPLETKPGNVMVGTHLHRHITWAEQARPFLTYLARVSHMLQQGRPVADIAYLLAEGAPSTPPIWGSGTTPPPPAGYDHDFINADILLNRLGVGDDGRLTLPDGPAWRVLVLPDTDAMRPELARKLRELVRTGATIIGPRPTHSPSLQDQPAADRELAAITADLWGDLDGVSRTIRHFGKGRVVWGRSLLETLRAIELPPDFEPARGPDGEIAWRHRRVGETDIYFVANISDQPLQVDARFRTRLRDVELWDPLTGRIELAGFSGVVTPRTTVPLRLPAHGSVFVVFRREPTGLERSQPAPATEVLAELPGPWEISFPPDLGSPEKITLPELASWTDHKEPGVQYFSGTATYVRTLEAPTDWFAGDHALLLDLGRVGDLAEVILNGRSLGTAWTTPYEIDLSGVLVPGENQLEIRVTNQWTNRIVGDRRVREPQQVLRGTPVTAGGIGQGQLTTLPDSGLLGPVRIVRREVRRVPDAPDGSVADRRANYTEAFSRRYTLPPLLTLASGTVVTDATTWTEKRRPELLRLFEDNEYGRVPGRPDDIRHEITEQAAPAFDGRAVRRQVTLHFADGGPTADVLLYLPAGAKGPVPVVLQAGFTANNLAVDDPGVKVGRVWNAQQKARVPADATARRFGRFDVPLLLAHGFGVAFVNYADFEPDTAGAIAHGVRQRYHATQAPGPHDWGTISAWSWGLSRVLDYLETDPDVDARRVALFGVSRLGKTVLWTAARDPRFAAVIASCSGEGGAALSRRNYGETVAHLTAPTRYPYQFAPHYAEWAGREIDMPMDSHQLIALVAPRPVLLQTGDTDRWSDPKGEFLAALAARPAFELFGRKGPPTDLFPAPGVTVGDTLAYYMQPGGHGSMPANWSAAFIPFLERHLLDEAR